MPIHDHGRGPVFRGAVTGLMAAAAALLAGLGGLLSRLDDQLAVLGLAALCAGMSAYLSLMWSLTSSQLPHADPRAIGWFKKNLHFREPIYP